MARAYASKLIVLSSREFDCKMGDSIAVNGCCLTAVAFSGSENHVVDFDVSSETLSKTNIGSLKTNSTVNLERAARMSDRIGGHLVSGHVDTTARLISFEPNPNGSLLKIALKRDCPLHGR